MYKHSASCDFLLQQMMLEVTVAVSLIVTEHSHENGKIELFNSVTWLHLVYLIKMAHTNPMQTAH